MGQEGAGEAARARVRCMVEVQRVGSNLDIKGSIFEGEREGIQDLCAEGDGVWY